MAGRLAGRVAFVTSGGGALAETSTARFAAEGAEVVSGPDEGVDVLHVTSPDDAACAAPVAAAMADAGGGSIITTVSTRALAGDVGGLDDAVAGGGVVALTLGLATTYGKRGVRVNCVAVPADAANVSSNLVPRSFRPDDAALLALFLASDDASFVTGQVLRCDGGQLAHLPHYASLVAAGASTAGSVATRRS